MGRGYKQKNELHAGFLLVNYQLHFLTFSLVFPFIYLSNVFVACKAQTFF